jgi:hypothetical protein
MLTARERLLMALDHREPDAGYSLPVPAPAPSPKEAAG